MVMVSIDGKDRPILRRFSDTRLLVSYDGLVVLADLVAGAWQLSEVPASVDEEAVIKELSPDGTTVVVSKDS